MKDHNFAIHDGNMYRKVPEGKFTYTYASTVEDFIMTIINNPVVADICTPVSGQLIGLLSKPACRLIQPIPIDFNFIEVENEYCFDIEKKQFIKNPLDLKGSPRSFVRYTYNDQHEVPKPKKFIEGQ